MSELDCKTYSVFEIHPRATPKPSLTSRDHLHGRRRSRCCQVLRASDPPCRRQAANRTCTVLYPTKLVERSGPKRG